MDIRDPIFNAIYNSKHFDFILPRHEQGAGHIAEGYARASGKPGVVTSGPEAKGKKRYMKRTNEIDERNKRTNEKLTL